MLAPAICTSARDLITALDSAGVVGLAIARALTHAGREVLVLESEAQFGTQTSSRNSEVVHAGLYYPPGSLKARLCLEGKTLLTRFCEEHGVALRTPGKLLIATEEAQRAKLDAIEKNASLSGVTLKRLSAADVHALEPKVNAIAGLWSGGTGIVDSDVVMVATVALPMKKAVRGKTNSGPAKTDGNARSHAMEAA